MRSVDTVILCGGKSSRMGTDKALLKIGNESFLEHKIRTFRGSGVIYLSVGEQEHYAQAKEWLEQANIALKTETEEYWIEDIYVNCGPLGGLHAAAKKCNTDRFFVTPVDLPFVDRQLKKELDSYFMPGIDAVVPIDIDGRLHPLCAVYRKNIESVLQSQLEKRDYRVRDFLEKIKVCYVPVSKLTLGEKKLMNLNTPEDYRNAMQYAQQKTNSKGIPIIGVAAYSGTGKTTFLEKLIVEFKKRTLKVAVVKHDGHDFIIDKEGKDTDRFTKAGADIVSIISGTKAVTMEHRGVTLQQMLDSIRQVDVILIEGFKKEKHPKILLYREAAMQPPAMNFVVEQPICIVSDKKDWSQAKCPIYGLEDIGHIADFLIQYVNAGKDGNVL